MEKLDGTGFWSEVLFIFSLTFSNPFIDLRHDLVRLFARKHVEYEVTLFSIISHLRFPVLREILIPSVGEFDFWLVHRSSSYTLNGI